MNRKLFIPLAALVVLLASGCSGSKAPSSFGAIDWVPFIQFDGTMYIASSFGPGDENFDRSVLGPEFKKVNFNVAANVGDPNYKVKDGDAAFLDKGTPIYSVTGYRPSFMLASDVGGRVTVYLADSVPNAALGGDMLDLRGMVQEIRLLSSQDATTEIGVLDAAVVDDFVTHLLAAPVQKTEPMSELTFFVEFRLLNGILFQRAYFGDTGELSRGIMLPETAQSLLEVAAGQP